MQIVWTDYLVYRARLRGIDLTALESVLLSSTERYLDTETRRVVVIGRYQRQLIAIPIEEENGAIIPITVHSVTRQQVRLRIRTGRFLSE